MRNIKFFKILFVLAVILNFPFLALAVDYYSNSTNAPIKDIQGLINILTSIVNVMYTAFFIVAIMFIILAAFNYLTAQDDPEKIKSATRQIMWAAVAIAVALISVGANQIIEKFLE